MKSLTPKADVTALNAVISAFGNKLSVSAVKPTFSIILSATTEYNVCSCLAFFVCLWVFGTFIRAENIIYGK